MKHVYNITTKFIKLQNYKFAAYRTLSQMNYSLSISHFGVIVLSMKSKDIKTYFPQKHSEHTYRNLEISIQIYIFFK